MTDNQQQQHEQNDRRQEKPETHTPSNATSSAGYSLLSSRIPAPLQHLFDRFPLVTYPANELPARSPRPEDRTTLPTLYVFISEEDAARGRPSFNPSCLKWQTFLKIAGVKLRVVPSTNHASPTGALPFLIPPASPHSAPGTAQLLKPASEPVPIPSHKLHSYALEHRKSVGGRSPAPPKPNRPPLQPLHKIEAYTALLDHSVRRAWLQALYLTEANTDLLTKLYLAPSTSSAAVRRILLAQLRRAAAAEVATDSSSGEGRWGGIAPRSSTEVAAVFSEAKAAFTSLAELLMNPPACTLAPPVSSTGCSVEETEKAAQRMETMDGSRHQEDEEEKGGPWFFGATLPTLFDASVFAYTHLLLDGSGLEWVDRTLPDMVGALPALVSHRHRLLGQLWGHGDNSSYDDEVQAGNHGALLAESLAWEKV